MTKEESGPNKRRKLTSEQLLPSGNIRGAFELHNLLRFKQNGGPEVKAGVDEFKKFCTDTQHNENLEERQLQFKVLKQYCDEQSSSNGEELDFPDLLSIWSFAEQSNNESLLSSVPAALSQFFRTISSELDFREFGLSLCQSLLKRDQVRLFDRGFSSPKIKGFLISPCLRLMTEVVSFDGGAMVGNVFSRRDILLKRLDILLDPPSQKYDGGLPRPTVRSNALKLLIALLKYLEDIVSKEELVAQAKSLHACFKYLVIDDPRIVRDVLGAIRKHLVDADISKDSKKRLLNSNNLSLLANLYDYEEGEQAEEGGEKYTPVREAIHDFLIHACTSNNGVYVPQTGWYPMGFHPDRKFVDDKDAIDLGLESPYYSDDYSTNVPIKNTTLSTFLQKLKPGNDTLQADLAISIFEHAPELVADYFCRRPKPLGTLTDDAEWRGQFAFLFSVVSLPPPKYCGWCDGFAQSPPPVSVVLESIMPRQMDRATLSQCLKSNDDLLKVSASKMMVTVSQKLENVLKVFRSASRSELWHQGASKLRSMVISRLPQFAELVAAVRQSEESDLAQEALLQCMASYPGVSGSYDPAPATQGVLQQLQSGTVDDDKQASLLRQLENLMKLSRTSKNIKWSSFVDLLAYAAQHEELRLASRDCLMPRLLEKGALQNEAAFWALMNALRSRDLSTGVLQNLENCVSRVTKQPVKYLDQLEQISKRTSTEDQATSLLAISLAEQWSFMTDSEASLQVGFFVSYFFACLESVGEHPKVLDHLRQTFSTSDQLASEIERLKQESPHVVSPHTEKNPAPEQENVQDVAHTEPLDLSDHFSLSASTPKSLKGLDRWDKVDLESELYAAETSRLASLILCLSSPSEEIRLSAQQTLLSLTHQVQASSYSEKDQLYLLVRELTETTHEHTLASPNTPLPTLIPSLAIFLLCAIVNPSNPMYSTANKFLLRSPSWTPFTRLIPYWTNIILLSEPDSDDPAAPVLFVSRYLDFLMSGLRTAADMDLYRRSGIFERMCSLYLAPATKRDTRKKILHLIYQAMMAKGGADTLITRVGVRAWLKVVKGRESGSELGRIVQAMEVKLEQKKDNEYIGDWEHARPILKKREQKQNVAMRG